MEKHKIIHLREQCISCGACAAITPEFWEMDDEGLATLKGSKRVNSHFELDISTEEAKAKNQDAVDVCPVQIIKIEKKKD